MLVQIKYLSNNGFLFVYHNMMMIPIVVIT